jgi:hypothetical protein
VIRDTLTNQPIIPGPVPPGTPPIRVALVGCGKTKLDHPAPARRLYVGNLFTMTRDHVEARLCAGEIDAWYVLSARHGILTPDQVVDPYDATMQGMNQDALRIWVNRVDGAFRCGNPGYGKWGTKGGRLVVDIYAGAAYTDPLLACWRGISWEINTPLAGLQMGERLGWLKDHRPSAM